MTNGNAVNSRSNKRLLVVFFEGTDNTIEPVTTQIGLFFSACVARRIYDESDIRGTNTKLNTNLNSPISIGSMSRSSSTTVSESLPLKIGFDGCAKTHGIKGALFASGLDSQCNTVVNVVNAILEQQIVMRHKQQILNPTDSSSNYSCTGVRVVAVGLSRGGIACMKLAQKLSNLNSGGSSLVSVSLLLFDPVPGNAVLTGFPYTGLFSQNLESCTNLKRVLAIYPYEPLPDFTMHAPTLASYPQLSSEQIQIEEDVTLGCHQGSLFITSKYPKQWHEYASNLSFHRIYEFLKSENVKLQIPDNVYQPSTQHCYDLCNKELKSLSSTQTVKVQSKNKKSSTNNDKDNDDSSILSSRITHDMTGRNRKIIRRNNDDGVCQYLNKHHQQLAEKLKKTRNENDDDDDNDSDPATITESYSSYSFESFESPSNAAKMMKRKKKVQYQLDFQDSKCSLWFEPFIPMCGSHCGDTDI